MTRRKAVLSSDEAWLFDFGKFGTGFSVESGTVNEKEPSPMADGALVPNIGHQARHLLTVGRRSEHGATPCALLHANARRPMSVYTERRTMRQRISTIAVAIFAFCIGYGQDMNRAMLTVNGESISRGEYYRRMEFLPDVGKVVNDRFVERTPAFLTIERLVNEKIILQLAKRHGVAPTPGEVENEFNFRRQDFPEQIRSLLEFGVTEEEIKGQIAIEMAQFNLLTKGVTVTDQQISDHYNNNRFFYSIPAKATLRVIVVKTEADKARVDAALRSRSFGEVAREHSVDLSKFADGGGMLGEIPIDRLPQNVRSWVEVLDAGKNTPWIESSDAHLIYHIEKKTPEQQLPLDDKLRRQIRKKMMLDMGRARNDIKSMMDEMLKTVKVVIDSPALQKIWDSYIKDYQTINRQ